MEDANDEKLQKNLWHQQQHASGDNNQQFYGLQYQPMQAVFEQQRESQQGTPVAPTTENLQFLYDNHGPYLKIYFNENNSDYELFDRNQHTLPNYTNRDGMNNFMPNTQAPLPFMNPQDQQSVPTKNPSIQRSVIHHIVSSLGPNKTGSYSPFGETIVNNNAMPVNEPNVFINAPQPSMSSVRNMPLYNENLTEDHASRNSVESHLPNIPSQAVNMPAAPTVHVKKARIVAEVRPMRMSYSDVVSKNAVNGQDSATPSAGSTNSASSSPNTTLPVTSKGTKADKSKFPSFEKKLQDADKENLAKTKKSPINSSIGGVSSGVQSDAKRLASNIGKSEKPPTQGPSVKKRLTGHSKDSSIAGRSSMNQSGGSRLQRNRHTSDSEEDEDNSSMVESDEDFEEVPMEFYNVRKNVYHGEHHNIEKIVTTKGATSYKKTKPTTSVATKKAEKSQKRTGKTTSRKRQKHEVLLKLCMAWGEYIWKFILWLGILVYDVSYLSCGIIWDRMSWCYQCAAQGFETLRQELNGSPGKAAWLWVKNKWKMFDAKFDKKSRWAFWRWLFKKKQKDSEQFKDYYKDGKLPKTAEEAMKSLLNCKGKDAYSILGVSPNCSQEQIRKHYKKIAVLVHPDKNKQAGAEEAFKVLQRSFELIGEPDCRQQYDQSMAEALHAEKAFTELNDLLVQLQTKISEAANTIRCSSCCFRHPRKPTGRKPFAARECSTCKIRHPAREGDIWAETSCFGFRWKYLALMEGNVYDITQWALCQRGALSHLQANSCVVQYKIVLGGNGNHQQNQAHEKEKLRKDAPAGEPSMDDFFLNNIYAGQNPQQHQNASRRRFKKN